MKTSKFCGAFTLKIGIIGALLVSSVIAMDNSTRTKSQGTLVFDQLAAEEKVAKKYRVIADLRASGSGQFSSDELYRLLAAIPAPKSNIWIIDLRQESHGFIDGIPVSWMQDQNAINKGKTATQIEKEEKQLLVELSKQKSVTVYNIKKLNDGKFSFDKPVTMLPELVESEQQLVTSYGAQYKRIYVLDHNKPDDWEVDSFVAFIRKVKASDWLHFHCRGGKGRSSTFIAMYDIVKNAHNATFVEIMQHQAQLGNIALYKMPTAINKRWKSTQALRRYEFLKKFYIYVIDENGYQKQSWSAWNKAKNPAK